MWRSMESGGGGGGGGGGGSAAVAGKKRKAAGGGGGSGYGGDRGPVMRREPRRGLGVAELERIRVQLEAAQSLFMIPSSLSSSSSSLATQLRLPPPPPPHVPGVRYGQQQQYVGNGGVQRDHHFTPYYGGSSMQQHCTNDVLIRLLAPSGSSQAFSRQISQVADKCVVNASSPLLRQQQGSSEELYRLQLQDYHRRRAQPRQHCQSIPFVNLVDSDEDDESAAAGVAAGAGDELDLELRL